MRAIGWMTVALTALLVESPAMAQASSEHAQAGRTGYQAIAEELVALVDSGKAYEAIDWVNAHNPGFADRDKSEPDCANH